MSFLSNLDGCSHSHVDIVVFKASLEVSRVPFNFFFKYRNKKIARCEIWAGQINSPKPSSAICTRVFALVCSYVLLCCNKNVVRAGLTRLIHCFRFSMVTQYWSKFIVLWGGMNSQWTILFMSQKTDNINFWLNLPALMFAHGRKQWQNSFDDIGSSES